MKNNMMIKQTLHLTCLLAASIGIASCSGLNSKYYVGEKSAISEEYFTQESVWMYGDDTFYVRRTEPCTYVVARLEWKEDTGAYKVDSHVVVPTKLGDHWFLNIKGTDCYKIFRIVPSGENNMVLFRADREKLVQDIADGILCAHTNKHNEVFLDGTKEEQDAYILKNIDSIFSMESASGAQRISEKKTE